MDSYHYKAFISYNHNPRDSKVTRHLQNKLENFRIPKGLRNGRGPKGVGRVFLDKGELEVAGDLDKKILWALEHSEYLIVICSPESVESPWVKKEIEYFLQFHEKGNILTVVTEGEPMDVLPEALLFREVVSDTGEHVRIPQEPLACDYRGSIRKAEKTELPRLVAALIGCRYDDLMQRQRNYKMKRLIAVIASAAVAFACFACYMIWSNIQINENYEASLKEQSESLSLQSAEALEKGDRIKAVEYALQALPTQKQDRPVISDAVFSLSEAMDLYRTPEAETLSAVRTLGAYRSIRDVAVSQDEPFLAMVSGDGALSIRNTGTGAYVGKKYAKKTSRKGDIRSVTFAAHGKLVLLSADRLAVYDCAKEKELWSVQPDCAPAAADAAIAGNETICFAAKDEDHADAIIQVDLSSGKEKARTKLPEVEDLLVEQIIVSDDGSRIAGWYAQPLKDTDKEVYEEPFEDALFMIDTDSGKFTALGTRVNIWNMVFTEQGQLVVCVENERPTAGDMYQYDLADLTSASNRMVFTNEKERTVKLEAIDAATGKPLWLSEFTESFSGIPRVDMEGSKDLLPGQVVCAFGSRMKAYDQDGRETMTCVFASPIRAFWKVDPDAQTNYTIRAVLLGGQLALCDPRDHEMVTMSDVFQSPVSASFIQDKQVFIEYSEKGRIRTEEALLQYAYRGSDPRWESYETALPAETEHLKAVPFEGSFVEYDNANGELWILRREADTGKILWKETYSSDNLDLWNCLGASGDVLWFDGEDSYVSGKKCRSLRGVDLKTGKLKDDVFSLINEPEISYIAEERSLMETADGFLYISRKSSYDPGENADKIVSRVNLKDKTITSRPIEFGETDIVMCADPDGGAFYIFDGSVIRKESADGKEQYEVKTGKCTPRGIAVSAEGDLIACGNTDGQTVLYRYLAKNGQFITNAFVPKDTDITKFTDFTLQVLPHGELLAGMDTGTSAEACVLGGDVWGTMSVIRAFIAYNEEKQQFLLRGEDEIGHIPYCSLPELIRMGGEEVK